MLGERGGGSVTFDDYSAFRRSTDLPSTNDTRFGPGIYPTLGLAGESGEVAEKIKKLYRDRDGQHDPSWRRELLKETGDVLWYLDRILADFGMSLSMAAQANIEKLTDRMNRGTLSGNGDNR